MKPNMLVAMDECRGIGKNGELPWHLKADMEHFKKVTKDKVVVMGHRTYNSLPEKYRPLPERVNIILSRTIGLRIPRCLVFNSIEDVLRIAELNEVWIIGGAEVYAAFLPHVDRIIVTHVRTKADCDTFFPLSPKEIRKTLQRLHKTADEENDFAFTITEYQMG